MISLIKVIIWIVGFVVVSNFVLGFFHSRVDWVAVENTFRSCYETVTPCQNVINNKLDSTPADREQCSASCLSGFSSWIKPQQPASPQQQSTDSQQPVTPQ